MNPKLPPSIASWILERFMPNGCDEALVGDLLESFRAGRSVNWYRRQVLIAVLLGWTKSLLLQWPSLVFAFAWATTAPAWTLLITRLYHTFNLTGPIWRLPWPWSFVCYTGVSIMESLLFIWAGVLTFLLVLVVPLKGKLDLRLGRALAASIAGLVLAYFSAMSIQFIFAPMFYRHSVDWRTLTLPGEMLNFSLPRIMMRLPYLIAMFCALWGAVTSSRRAVKTIN
jgi:hypothetical protein